MDLGFRMMFVSTWFEVICHNKLHEQDGVQHLKHVHSPRGLLNEHVR